MSSTAVKLVAALVVGILAALVVVYQPLDSQVQDRVVAALSEEGYLSPQSRTIGVDLLNGRVTLDGKLRGEERRQAAAKVAAEVLGVRSVTNNIVAIECDEAVLSELRSILDEKARLDYSLNNDCVVTLAGWVATPALKEALARIATSVAGVAGIKNDLVVGVPEVNVSTLEGAVEYRNDRHGITLALDKGLAAAVSERSDGDLRISVPADSTRELRGTVRDRAARILPGTVFEATTSRDGITSLEVENGSLILTDEDGTETELRAGDDVSLTIINPIHVKNIYFDFAASTIRAESVPSLDRIATVLNQNLFVSMRIEGHTDSVGDESYNLKLSQKRAEAVRDELVKRGVAVERITATGVGESQAIASNDSPEGRADNRRIEFELF